MKSAQKYDSVSWSILERKSGIVKTYNVRWKPNTTFNLAFNTVLYFSVFIFPAKGIGNLNSTSHVHVYILLLRHMFISLLTPIISSRWTFFHISPVHFFPETHIFVSSRSFNAQLLSLPVLCLFNKLYRRLIPFTVTYAYKVTCKK